MRTDHPRVCGENCHDAFSCVMVVGSPPRMRGERCGVVHLGCQSGITPAYAGRTDVNCGVNVLNWDHPRVCGENWVRMLIPWAGGGSPPRMRGERTPLREPRPSRRITPAYAGRTVVDAGYRGLQQDHPRVCGENECKVTVNGDFVGSPPRMRGEHEASYAPPTVDRITPAYAGRTCSPTNVIRQTRDHPRVCGENRRPASRCCPPMGSPPRMRGELHIPSCGVGVGGITPAYAGRT